MRNQARAGFLRLPVAMIGAGIASFLGGCQTAPPVPDAVAPSLRLIDSTPLVLAGDCDVSGSVFVEFTVLTSGRADDLRLPAVPACVREALTAWVGSFRYMPPASDTRSGIEWMLVTARKRS